MMNVKTKAVITLAAAAAVLIGALVILKYRSHPAVTVTLRIAVGPANQVDFVTGRANSAQFKYLVGKESGVRPIMAQKLSILKVPKSSFVEAHVSLMTKAEAQRYVEVFMGTLRAECAGHAQVAIAQQSIR